jgi:type II secretory pathway pseudopilin PulG
MRLTPRWSRGRPQRARLRAASCSGFTYLGVMFIVGVLALTASAAGVVWSTAQRRDNERELVFVGRQFQAAIERYRQSTTGAQTPYPRTLQELLRDDRAIVPQRHLRRLFVDPITGNAQWGLIQLPGGGIVGVHSLSDRVPFPRKTVLAGFDVPPAATYQGWRFIAPSAAALLAPPAASAATAPAPADSALGLPTSATSVIPATPAAPAQSPRTDAQAEPNPSGAADAARRLSQPHSRRLQPHCRLRRTGVSRPNQSLRRGRRPRMPRLGVGAQPGVPRWRQRSLADAGVARRLRGSSAPPVLWRDPHAPNELSCCDGTMTDSAVDSFRTAPFSVCFLSMHPAVLRP